MKVSPNVGLGINLASETFFVNPRNLSLNESCPELVDGKHKATAMVAKKEYELLKATQEVTGSIDVDGVTYSLFGPRAEILRDEVGRDEAYNHYMDYNSMTNAERKAVHEWRRYNLEKAFNGGEYLDIVARNCPEQLGSVIEEGIRNRRYDIQPGAFHSAEESMYVFLEHGLDEKGELPADVKIIKRSELYAAPKPAASTAASATETAVNVGKKAAKEATKSGGKWGWIVGGLGVVAAAIGGKSYMDNNKKVQQQLNLSA